MGRMLSATDHLGLSGIQTQGASEAQSPSLSRADGGVEGRARIAVTTPGFVICAMSSRQPPKSWHGGVHAHALSDRVRIGLGALAEPEHSVPPRR